MSDLCSFRCAGQQLNKSELNEAQKGRKWHHVLVGEVKPASRQSDPFSIAHQVIQLLHVQVTPTPKPCWLTEAQAKRIN